MAGLRHLRPSDLRAASRLAVDATLGVTDLVEAVHRGIAAPIASRGGRRPGGARGIAGLVYRSIRALTRLTGGGLERALARLEPALADGGSSAGREAVIAALNGVLGDYLAAHASPLAIPMRLRRTGLPLDLERAALAAACPQPGARVVVLIHGLCLSDLQWRRQGHDHGDALARDLGASVLYLHYNTGLHVSANGRAASETLEALVREWPVEVEELAIVAHSMGGLVARSAHHAALLAGHAWPRRLRRIVFLGTPHHGAPLERGGSAFETVLGATPYAAPFARLGRMRSAGITDLRHGNLVDGDWAGRDRFARSGDRRQPVPLPAGVACHAVGATLGGGSGGLADRLAGDGLVPLGSALGDHPDAARALGIPESHRWIAIGRGHHDLLSDPAVYARLRDWLAA